MTRPVGRLLRRSGIAALVIGAALTGWTVDDAGAWSDGSCPTSSGVTVVIDFHELGGGVHVRCATGAVTSGFEALRQAGIDYQSAVRFPGFLCKIAGKPANDPCVNTSPVSAYWSYWLAPRGGQWCYSNFGAGNRTPPQGTVEGWSFSMDTTGATAPPPRTNVPERVPGAPSALPPGECDQRSAAPSAPPTTTSPRRPDPPPAVPTAPATPAYPSGGPASDGQPDEAPNGSPASRQGGADAPAASPPVSAVPEAVGDEPTHADGEPTGAVAERHDDATGQDGAGPPLESSGEEVAATVELGGADGRGSPVPAMVTVAVIALFVAMAKWRRRASTR